MKKTNIRYKNYLIKNLKKSQYLFLSKTFLSYQNEPHQKTEMWQK